MDPFQHILEILYGDYKDIPLDKKSKKKKKHKSRKEKADR